MFHFLFSGKILSLGLQDYWLRLF